MMKRIALAIAVLLPCAFPARAQPTLQTVLALHEQLAAACPDIAGVSVNDWTDRSKWRIDFSANASVACRAAARQALAQFDVTSKPAVKPLVERLKALGVTVDELKAALR